MAAVGAAAARAEVLHESLDLRVDLEKQEVKGHATVWVLLPPLPAGELETVDEGVFDYRLHARQMEIHEVKVNDLAASYVYPHPVDLLRDFVPPGNDGTDGTEEGGASARMDGEALDLHYRCQLIASQEGELNLQLPRRRSWRPPPTDLQAESSKEATAIPQVVLNADLAAQRICKIEIDYTLRNPVAGLRFESHPAHAYSMRCPSVLHDVDGPRCWFPCADRTTDVFTLDMTVAVVSPVPPKGGEVEKEDEKEGKDGEGSHAGEGEAMNGKGANSSSSTSTSAALNTSSPAINREEEHPAVVLVGGGQLLGKEKNAADGTVVWRYAIETPITASAVSLVVGRFGKYVDPGVPRLTHHYLLREERRAATSTATGGGSSAAAAAAASDKTSPLPPPPRSWVSHSVEGMGPAMSFLADFFHLAPGGGAAAAAAAATVTSKGATTTTAAPAPAAVIPYLEHHTVFVKGLPEASVAFHGLSLHRSEDLHPPRVFDPSMTFHLALTEGLFASWLLPRVRPRSTRDRWIYHGVLGYLLLLYVRRRYGEHEYRYRLLRLMDAVTALERSGQSTPLLPPDSVLLASEVYSPASLELVRVKPPIILHMIEQRVGRKPLRDVLRSVACPTPLVPTTGAAAAAGAASEGAEGMDVDDDARLVASPNATPSLPPSAASVGPVRPQAVKTLTFLRLCLKTSSRGDFIKNLRECWLEGRGPACFTVSYAFDRRAPKPEVALTIRQVVPPWGRLFVGTLRIRIMEDAGPYDYDREINEAEHVFTFKPHSKVRKTGGGRQKKQQVAEGAGSAGATPAGPPKLTKAARLRAEAAAAAAGGGGSGEDGAIVGGGEGEKPKKRSKKAELAAEAAAAQGGGGGGGGAPAIGVVPMTAAAVAATASSTSTGTRRDEDEYAASRREHYSPIVWVRLDPDLQWITEWEWENMPEYLFLEQLHRDPDAAAQCLALRALTAYPKPGQDAAAAVGAGGMGGVMRPSLAALAMSDCLRGKIRPGWVEPSLSVRMEAARALAAWQNNHAPGAMVAQETGWRGLGLLLQDYRERFFDASGRVPLPADFTDEAEYQLQKSVLHAISLIRAKDRCSPPLIWDFLRTILEAHDNSRNPFDDSAFLRTVLLGVTNLHIGPSQDRAGASLATGLFPQVLRYLSWHQEVGSYNHAVEAAALRAMCNLELIRGGVPGESVDYLEYAKPVPDQVLGEAALRNPSSLVPLRLAALEAVARLRVREAKVSSAVPTTAAAATAGEGLEGPRRALQWVLGVIQHEKATGSITFRYKALQVLFEALRHPLDYRPSSVTFHQPVALAPTHFLDHLTHECPAYEKLDAGVLSLTHPPSSSRKNPFLNSLRSTACAEASAGVRRQLWRFVTRETWYNQPLRGLAMSLHQAIWGTDPFPSGGGGGGGEGEEMLMSSSSSSRKKGFAGLENVYLELLSLRADGVFSLRSTLFDERDWRVWRNRRARRLAMLQQQQGGGGKRDNGTKTLSWDDLSEDERGERKVCLESREAITKSNSKVRLKLSIAPSSSSSFVVAPGPVGGAEAGGT
jgi:hypothetical protein